MTSRIRMDLGNLAAAHRLMNHGGSCELLHGHNWSINVWLDAEVNSETGIAVDFLDFEAFKNQLIEKYDHGIWLHREDPLISVLKKADVSMKLTIVDGEPTAENMAATFLDHFQQAFPTAERWGMVVGEMPGATAEVIGEPQRQQP